MRAAALIVNIIIIILTIIVAFVSINQMNDPRITEEVKTIVTVIIIYFFFQIFIVAIAQVLIEHGRKGIAGTLILLFVGIIGGILIYCIPVDEIEEDYSDDYKNERYQRLVGKKTKILHKDDPYAELMKYRIRNKNPKLDSTPSLTVDSLESWDCPNCFMTNHDVERCSACGYKINYVPKTSKELKFKINKNPIIRCKNCGMEVSSSNLYCPHCNEEID